MLLIRPRRLIRSRNTSCSTPFSTTAARASWVLALTRISVLIAAVPCSPGQAAAMPAPHARLAQQFGGFEQRQSHHAGIAAAQIGDENRRPSLYGIGPRLVGRLAGLPVILDFFGCEVAKSDFAAADSRFQTAHGQQCDGGEHLVSAPGELLLHALGILPVRRLPQYLPAEDHRRIRRQYGNV